MANETTNAAGAELPFTLKEKLANLRNQLEANNPGYATILAEIHAITKNNPDYVYAMSDEEFQAVISGLGKYQQVQITTTKAKSGKMTRAEGNLLSEDSV